MRITILTVCRNKREKKNAANYEAASDEPKNAGNLFNASQATILQVDNCKSYGRPDCNNCRVTRFIWLNKRTRRASCRRNLHLNVVFRSAGNCLETETQSFRNVCTSLSNWFENDRPERMARPLYFNGFHFALDFRLIHRNAFAAASMCVYIYI